MKIKKGDTIIVLQGKDKGKTAKVLRCFPAKEEILTDGLNLKKVHKRPKKQGEKGQVAQISFPIRACKVKVICPKCSKPSRMAIVRNGKIKNRKCKKCSSVID
jgi:large subunit ribosomal protein L24